MGELQRRVARQRHRRARRRRANQRAVVSVVGTLLSLLVFLSLFGIFLQQYLPLWMTDNESQFTARTQTSFADLKSNIDLQTILQGTLPLSTPFTMSSDGVPVLAQPTAGVLNFIPKAPGIFANVSVTPGPGGGGTFFQNFSLGTLTMTLPNRYYPPQFYSFENDAVIQSQTPTQQLVLYPPGLAFNVSGTQVGVTLNLLQLLGNATQAVSTGSQEVTSHFFFTQTFRSNVTGTPLNAKFVIGTHYPCAWTSFLSTAFLTANVGAHGTIAPAKCVTSLNPSVIVVSFTGLTTFSLVLSEVSLVVGVGVE